MTTAIIILICFMSIWMSLGHQLDRIEKRLKSIEDKLPKEKTTYL